MMRITPGKLPNPELHTMICLQHRIKSSDKEFDQILYYSLILDKK